MMGVDAVMMVQAPSSEVTDDRIVEWSYKLGAAFGFERFLVYRLDGRRALTRADEDDIRCYNVRERPGWTTLRVNIFSRYYGPGYERGDLPFLLALARFLEDIVPASYILYGSDSGDTLEYFGRDEQEDLWDHFVSVQYEPYHRAFTPLSGQAPPSCGFCGDVPMSNHGGGAGVEFYECHGCGLRLKQFSDGHTQEVPSFLL
jgi:hypothetical protein